MVICVFAFVMVIGVSVVLLAGVASQQVSRQFGRQQAEYAAQSVIDTVCAQLADGTIDPVSAPEKKLTGGGVDDILGTYRITVEPYEAAGYVNTFKVSVDVERSGQKSAIYSLMKYEAGGAQVELAGLFDLMAGATHKYAVITEIKIPDLARAQIEKNSVMINFDASKDDPAILNGDEYTIQNNCSIELGTGRETWGKKIVLDASAGDLYVKLKPQSGTSAFTLPNGVSLLSKGEHNVYFFLDEETGTSGHTDFAMNTNCFVGRYEYYGKTIPDVGSDPLTPNLYLFSNAKGVSVSDLGQYNSSYAFIYVPYGTVELSGAAMDPYGAKLCGSAVGAVVNMGGSGQKYVQYAAKGSIGGGGVAGWTRTGTYYMQNEGGA